MCSSKLKVVVLIGTLILVILITSLFIASGLGSNGDDCSKRKDPNWKEFDWDKKWSEYKNCEVEKVCLDDDEKCKDGVGWTNFTTIVKNMNRTEVEIIDLGRTSPCLQRHPDQNIDFDQYKSEVCHLAIVTNKGNETCKISQTQDRCPWISKSD